MSAVLGGIGFTAYAAANAFQDRFVLTRDLPGGSAWSSACWDSWRGTAATRSVDAIDKPDDGAVIGGTPAKYSFPADDALPILDRLLTAGPRRTVVSAGQLPERIAAWSAGSDPLRHNDNGDAVAGGTVAREDISADYERRLTALWKRALGADHVDRHANFFESGGNSLAGLELVDTIQAEFGGNLSMVALLEFPTIAGLTDHLFAARQLPGIGTNTTADAESTGTEENTRT
jgi:acyl carrier protein